MESEKIRGLEEPGVLVFILLDLLSSNAVKAKTMLKRAILKKRFEFINKADKI